MTINKKPFWKRKTLEEMTPKEWESLCDRCGICCLNKLEDEEQYLYTNVACSLLDVKSCLCKDYENRTTLMPDCRHLTAENLSAFKWLPSTCAYRLIAQKQNLKSWHPLVSGNPASVRAAGISIHGKIVGEDFIHPDQLIEHIVDSMISLYLGWSYFLPMSETVTLGKENSRSCPAVISFYFVYIGLMDGKGVKQDESGLYVAYSYFKL